jgi:DNA-binding NarL/FixJ family response regulator
MANLQPQHVSARDVQVMEGSSPRVALALASEELRRRAADAVRGEGFAAVDVSASLAELAADPPAEVTLFVTGAHQLLNAEHKELRAFVEAADGRPVVVAAEKVDLKVARRILDAGALGVVRAADVERTLVPAMHAALSGLSCFPSDLRKITRNPVLTNREKQILGMVVLGMSNADIARRLHLTESTVKSHLSVAYGKLGVRGRNEATAVILDPKDGLGMGILRISEEVASAPAEPPPD